MSDIRGTSLKTYWQVIDIIGKLAIPIVLGFMTWTLSRSQHDLAVKQAERQQQQIQATEELKVLEIFYKELLSEDPARKRLACAIVKMHGREDLLERLAIVAPELGLWTSIEISQNRFESSEVRGAAQRVRYNIAERLEISNPADGDSVDMFVEVHGTTPFFSMEHHYIIVTPYKTQSDTVESEASVTNGLIRGHIKLGSAAVGAGERFALRIIATNSTFTIGEAPIPLQESISSNSVTVTRRKEEKP